MAVSKAFKIPARTLRRHRDGAVKSAGKLGQGKKQYVPDEIEIITANPQLDEAPNKSSSGIQQTSGRKCY